MYLINITYDIIKVIKVTKVINEKGYQGRRKTT